MAVLHPNRGLGMGEHLPPGFLDQGPILGMDDPFDSPQQFFHAEPGEVFGGRTDEGLFSLGIDEDENVPGVANHDAEALFTGLQGFFLSDAVADVLHAAQGSGRCSIRGRQHHSRVLHPAHGTISMQQAVFHVVAPTGLDRGIQLLGGRLPVLGMNEGSPFQEGQGLHLRNGQPRELVDGAKPSDPPQGCRRRNSG